MSSDKPFPPSEEKLKVLREKGEIVKTKDVISLGVVSSIAFLLFVFFKNGIFAANFLEKNLASELTEPEKLKLNLFLLFNISLKVILAVLFFVMLLNLLQTKFFFKPNLATFNFSKSFNLGNYLAGFSSRISNYLLQIFRLMLFLCFSYMVLGITLNALEFYFIHYSTSRAGVDQQLKSALDLITSQPKIILLDLLLMFIGLAIISYFFNFIRFRAEHAMSRAEIESEGKEQEMSSLLKRNIRD